MKSKPKLKLLSFASIAVIAFLFAFSPAILANASTHRVALTNPYGIVNHIVAVRPPSPPKPGVSCTGNCVFISDIGNGNVYVIDGTGTLITTIADGGASGFGVTFDPATNHVYVFDAGTGTIFQITKPPFAVDVSASSINAGFDCYFGAYVPSNKMIYVTTFAGEVVPFNPSNITFGTPILTCGSAPEYIAYNAGDKNVYVADRSNCVDVINPTTNVDTPFTISNAIALNGVACVTRATLGKDCWISDQGQALVFEVTASGVVASITTASSNLWGDAFNAGGPVHVGSVYVTDVGTGGSIDVVSGSSYVTGISLNGGLADADCGNTKGHDVVVPNLFAGGGSSGAYGISTGNTIVFTANLGSTSVEPEGCARSD